MKSQREKMQPLVSQWQESGISQSEFARKNQLKEHAFRYWVSKLRKEDDDAPAFIALNGIAAAHICLHYPNGVELLLPPQTPVSVLKGLIHFEARCSR
jgi:hypothetical protein